MNNVGNTKHGHRTSKVTSPTYNTWHGMMNRCSNPKATGYKNYGGRGITVCEKWLDFRGFLKDMGEKPSGLTLDRIDNDKGYYKENCRWETWKNQHTNKRARPFKGYYFCKFNNDWTVLIKGKYYGRFKIKEKAILKVKEVLNVDF